VLQPPIKVRFGLVARYGAGYAGSRHRSEELPAHFALRRRASWITETASTTFEAVGIRLLGHRMTSRLAWKAGFNAKFPCGTGTSFMARIFSITRSIKS